MNWQTFRQCRLNIASNRICFKCLWNFKSIKIPYNCPGITQTWDVFGNWRFKLPWLMVSLLPGAFEFIFRFKCYCSKSSGRPSPLNRYSHLPKYFTAQNIWRLCVSNEIMTTKLYFDISSMTFEIVQQVMYFTDELSNYLFCGPFIPWQLVRHWWCRQFVDIGSSTMRYNDQPMWSIDQLSPATNHHIMYIVLCQNNWHGLPTKCSVL